MFRTQGELPSKETANLYHYAEHTLVSSLVSTSRWAWTAQFSNDGKMLGTGGGFYTNTLDHIDPTLKLWRVSDGHLLHELKSHTAVDLIRFSLQGKYVLSGGNKNGQLGYQVWRVEDGELQLEILFPKEPHGTELPLAADFFKGDPWVAVATMDGIQIWDYSKKQRLFSIPEEAQGLTDLLVADSNTIFAARSDAAFVSLIVPRRHRFLPPKVDNEQKLVRLDFLVWGHWAYDLEQSEDLVNWTVVEEHFRGTNDFYSTQLPLTPNSPRFFRAIVRER